MYQVDWSGACCGGRIKLSDITQATSSEISSSTYILSLIILYCRGVVDIEKITLWHDYELVQA